MAEIATIPAASPSRPSMKLTALIVATTTRIVSRVDSSGVSPSVPPPGQGSQSSWVPVATRIAPAPIWATSCRIADRPQRSSMIPTTTSSAPASRRPGTIPVWAKPLRNGGS